MAARSVESGNPPTRRRPRSRPTVRMRVVTAGVAPSGSRGRNIAGRKMRTAAPVAAARGRPGGRAPQWPGDRFPGGPPEYSCPTSSCQPGLGWGWWNPAPRRQNAETQPEHRRLPSLRLCARPACTFRLLISDCRLAIANCRLRITGAGRADQRVIGKLQCSGVERRGPPDRLRRAVQDWPARNRPARNTPIFRLRRSTKLLVTPFAPHVIPPRVFRKVAR